MGDDFNHYDKLDPDMLKSLLKAVVWQARLIKTLESENGQLSHELDLIRNTQTALMHKVDTLEKMIRGGG